MPSCFLAYSYFNPYLHVGPCFVIFALCHGFFYQIYILVHKLFHICNLTYNFPILLFWPQKFPKITFWPQSFPKSCFDLESFPKLHFHPKAFPKSCFDLETFSKLHFNPLNFYKLHFGHQIFVSCILAPKVLFKFSE